MSARNGSRPPASRRALRRSPAQRLDRAVRAGPIVANLVPVDLAAPSAGRRPTRIDEGLEPFEIALDPPLEEAELVTDALDDAFGIRIDAQGHPRLVRAHRREQHGPGVLGAVEAL